MGDADLVGTRWRAAPAAALGAYADGELVGSNFAANWGSFGFFGPLTVRPDLWDRGVARRLLEATMALFEQWGTRQAACSPSPRAPSTSGCTGKFGFRPQFLTPVMSKPVGARHRTAGRWSGYRERAAGRARGVPRRLSRADRRDVSGPRPAGRDPGGRAAAARRDRARPRRRGLDGFAVCHFGAGSEAGGGAATSSSGRHGPGPDAARHFDRLLAACEALADARGLERLVAGVNTARREAYRRMLARGFRTVLEGVAMQRPDEPGYNRPDCFVMDDWR